MVLQVIRLHIQINRHFKDLEIELNHATGHNRGEHQLEGKRTKNIRLVKIDEEILVEIPILTILIRK